MTNSTSKNLATNYVTKFDRHTIEDSEMHGKWSVDFDFRPARGDRPHLLVVFSSVGSKYGFGTMLEGIQCNVLRIVDTFDGAASYYVARNMDFSVSDSVQSLIQSYLARLGLTNEQITLAGASKGATAALYYGFKYGYKNIIASTPQYWLGNYSKGHFQLGESVLGQEQSDTNVEVMNQVFPELFENVSTFDQNVYLYSSTGDPQYDEHVRDFLPWLQKCTNFNMMMFESPTVQKHEEIVRQALPAILATMNLLTSDITPSIGDVEIGTREQDEIAARQYLHSVREEDTVLATVGKASINHGKLEINGEAFIPGLPKIGEPGDEIKTLVISNNDRIYEFPLESVPGLRTYREYFDKFIMFPEKGAYESQSLIDLKALEIGSYNLNIRIDCADENISRTGAVVINRVFEQRRPLGEHEILLRGNKQNVQLIKRNIIGETSPSIRFGVNQFSHDNDGLQIQGHMFLPGCNVEKSTDARYYMVLKSRHGVISEPLQTVRGIGNSQHVPEGDFGDYDWGFYRTSAGKPINVKALQKGKYTVFVSMSTGGAIFTSKATHFRILELVLRVF